MTHSNLSPAAFQALAIIVQHISDFSAIELETLGMVLMTESLRRSLEMEKLEQPRA